LKQKPPRDPEEPWFETAEHIQIKQVVEKLTDSITAPISKKEIQETLRICKKKKAAGTNGIPNECLQLAPEKVIHYLEIIFNQVLRTHETPTEWKQSLLYTIHKGGDAAKLSNSHSLMYNTRYSPKF
jgi:hypothetical protein